MSRSQQNETYKTAKSQNQGYYDNSQTSYDKAQENEQKFEDQLGKFTSSNPFVEGGEYQKTVNQQLSNTADAGAQAAGQMLQSQAVRTGANPNASIAATEEMQQQNERNLSGQEADATQNRLTAKADYDKTATALAEQPATFEEQLAANQGALAQGTLSTQEEAAKTPSFLDQLTQSLISGGSQIGSAYAGRK